MISGQFGLRSRSRTRLPHCENMVTSTITAKMNVLVYSGPEVLQSSLPILTSTLRSLLLPNYTVQTIASHTLINHPWAPSCALLVIPSFSSTTSGSDFTDRLSKFVNDGGSILAFSVSAKGRTKDVLALPASYEMGSSRSSASLNLPGSVTVDFSPPSTSERGLSNVIIYLRRAATA